MKLFWKKQPASQTPPSKPHIRESEKLSEVDIQKLRKAREEWEAASKISEALRSFEVLEDGDKIIDHVTKRCKLAPEAAKAVLDNVHEKMQEHIQRLNKDYPPK